MASAVAPRQPRLQHCCRLCNACRRPRLGQVGVDSERPAAPKSGLGDGRPDGPEARVDGEYPQEVSAVGMRQVEVDDDELRPRRSLEWSEPVEVQQGVRCTAEAMKDTEDAALCESLR